MRTLLAVAISGTLWCALVASEPLPAAHICDANCEHFQKGLDAARKDDWSGSIAEFSIVISSEPESARASAALINRGRARLMSGDREGSFLDFEAAYRIDPKSADALTWRAAYYAGKGDRRRSIEDCTRAIELDATHVSAYVRRGIAYGSSKEYAKAVADYTEALRLDSTNFVALLGRAVARDVLNDRSGAIADLETALVLDPNYEKAKVMLMRLRAKPSEPNQAQQHNAGSRPSSTDSSASKTAPSLGPRG